MHFMPYHDVVPGRPQGQWVDIPNAHFDPAKGRKLYKDEEDSAPVESQPREPVAKAAIRPKDALERIASASFKGDRHEQIHASLRKGCGGADGFRRFGNGSLQRCRCGICGPGEPCSLGFHRASWSFPTYRRPTELG
jgi:hypothetical protein